MKRKFTILTAALLLLTMIHLPGNAVGQTPILTTDLDWGTPQISENFNSLNTTSATAKINSDSQTAYGVFNKMYNNNTGNTYAIVNDEETFNSKILSLTSGSTSPLIASITKVNGDAVEFASTGAFSIRIAKTNYTMFGLYAADGNSAYAKADASVYLKFQVGSLTINDGSGWVSVGSYGYGHPDIAEIRVVYNNTATDATYGNGISIGAKKAHVFVNGSCVLDGGSPKEFTIPGKSLTVFRVLPNASNGSTCTIDDVNIYDALPTALPSGYRVTYNANGATGAVPVDNTAYDDDNNSVIVAGNTGSPALAKTGYTWSGWCLNNAGTGDVYGPDYIPTYTISENTTFYAKWNVNSYDYSLSVTGPDTGAEAALYVDDAAVASGAKIQYGKEVSVVVAVNSDYIYSIVVKDDQDNDVTVENDKFTMPASDVTVTVTTAERPTEASYIFNTDAGLAALGITKPSAGSGTDLSEEEDYVSGSITMNCTHGSSTNTRVWNKSGSTELRVYKDGTLTFSISEPKYYITKVTFTGTVNLKVGTTDVTDKQWTGKTQSVTFTNKDSNSALTTITVEYARFYTLDFFVNGIEATESQMEVKKGTAITTLPAATVPTGFTFDGWMEKSTNAYYNATTAPSMITAATIPTDDAQYAAVFHVASTTKDYTTLVTVYDSDNNIITDEDLYGINYITDEVLAESFENHGLVVVRNNGILDVSNEIIINENPANLIIEDGGQIIASNAVAATVQKQVKSFNDETEGGWKMIASPLSGSNLFPSNLLSDGYIYKYDEVTHYWRSNTSDVDSFDKLTNKVGYLYGNDNDFTIEFAGTLVANNAEVTGDLSYTAANGDLAGWNLVGNPFACNAYTNRAYYVTSYDNTEDNKTIFASYAAAQNQPIPPCTGILVKASATNEKVYFKNSSYEVMSAANNGFVQMNLEQQVVNRGASKSVRKDNAIVSFNEGDCLEKFVFNEDNAKLYIQQNGKDYAIAYSEGQGTMPVNFKAAEDGTYTLTVNPEGVEMNYLHLIDNMTGMDVDLLQTPSYSFNATTNDYENRFRLVFAAANNEDGASTGSASFAFMSDGNWIINNAGEATLQVIDINGRILSSERVNGSVSKTINATSGVYMLRLINGEKVMVQKIVVR